MTSIPANKPPSNLSHQATSHEEEDNSRVSITSCCMIFCLGALGAVYARETLDNYLGTKRFIEQECSGLNQRILFASTHKEIAAELLLKKKKHHSEIETNLSDQKKLVREIQHKLEICEIKHSIIDPKCKQRRVELKQQKFSAEKLEESLKEQAQILRERENLFDRSLDHLRDLLSTKKKCERLKAKMD